MAEPPHQPSKPDQAPREPRARVAPGKAALPVWRTAIARKLFAVLCLAAAAGLEYYLVNLPVGEVNAQFPATVRAGDEIVTFGDPGLLGGGTFSFMYAPPTEAEKVLLDAYFDNAQLSEPTLQAFKSFQIAAPSSPGVITYLTSGAGSAACSTKFQVEPAGANLKSVEFSQSGSDVTSGYRSLGPSFASADAVVTLTSQGAMEGGLSPCKIELSIGDWKQVTQGFLPIKIRVPAGAHFRFHWQNLDERASTWKTKSAALPLLGFGSSASDEFTAQTIAISSLIPSTGAPIATSFEARGTKQSPLTVLSLGVNQRQLEINASGKGRVLKEGKAVNTTDVLETLNKNPILSALFGAGNLALIGWAGRMFFPRRRKRKSES